MTCWLMLSPDDGWVIVEQDSSGPQGAYKFHTSIEYGSPVNGVRAPKRVAIDTAATRYTYDFDELVLPRPRLKSSH